MNDFTTASYKTTYGGDANLILSPLNIGTALSMALAGAAARPRGNPSRPALHYDYDSALGAQLADLTKAGNTGGNELHTAKRTLGAKKDSPSSRPSRTHSPTTTRLHPRPSISSRIPRRRDRRSNRWTEEHTKEKIKNLLPAGSLDAQTRVVLTSAIYFYGQMQDPFVTSHTQPAPFTLPAGATTQANFMNQTSEFGYTATPSAQILEMRYGRHRNGLRRPAPDDPLRASRPREIADTWKPDRLARPPHHSGTCR